MLGLLSRALFLSFAVHLQAENEMPDKEFDCGARRLAYEFAAEQWEGAGFQDDALMYVFDALRLQECSPAPPRAATGVSKSFGSSMLTGERSVFVDSVSGDDDRDGSKQHPLRSLEAAVALCRAQSLKSIALRRGKHYLKDTLVLTRADSGMTFAAYDGEEAVISGGVPLDLTFAPTVGGAWVADLHEAHAAPLRFTTLFLAADNANASSEERLIWAREPNGNPERDLQPDGYAYVLGPGSSTPWPTGEDGVHVAVDTPKRNSSVYPVYGQDNDPRQPHGGHWLHYGGYAKRFADGKGFWNGSAPTGMKWNSTGGFDRGYNVSGFNVSSWTNYGYDGAIAHVFHPAFWGNWQFPVGTVNTTSTQIDFAFTSPHGYGGWQEGHGGGMSSNRQPFFVEGVREALDVPGEWWLDVKAQQLLIMPNSSWFSNADIIDNGKLRLRLVAPVLKRLVDIQGGGESESAVANISFKGITFMHTAPTSLELYEVPSPGDWSIHRGAALFAEGAERLTVDKCRFLRVGGNALFLSGFAKRTQIRRSEFAWIGDSAIATVGRLDLADGFSVNSYPEDTIIDQNHFHEIGVRGKQTSALFSALSCRTQFTRNVAYNGPRAGINLNDGFCHGHIIASSLLFNWVRETQDHGPINTWNRAMYLQRSADGLSATTIPEWTYISRNFIMNGPSGNRDLGNLFPAIDNDDGSAYFVAAENFMVYGGGKNYLGQDKIWRDNIIAYPGRWSGDPCVQMWGGEHHMFFNNTCFVGNGGEPIGLDGTTKGFKCMVDWSDPTNLAHVGMTRANKYYTENATWSFECGNATSPGHLFNMSEMHQHGWELGSEVRDLSNIGAMDIVNLARRVLQLRPGLASEPLVQYFV